ncbi:Uncharacterized protein pbN1_09270 [Aromatoleum bremense]|nr:Uncharacterized protein pbN1_09270 [Aromatoleum bremense]
MNSRQTTSDANAKSTPYRFSLLYSYSYEYKLEQYTRFFAF